MTEEDRQSEGSCQWHARVLDVASSPGAVLVDSEAKLFIENSADVSLSTGFPAAPSRSTASPTLFGPHE